MSQLVESAIGWALVVLAVVVFLRHGGKVRSVLRTASVILGFVSFWPILGILFRASADYNRVAGYETFVMLGTIALCALPPALMFSLTRPARPHTSPDGTAPVSHASFSNLYQSSQHYDADEDSPSSESSEAGEENSDDEERSSRVADYQRGFDHGVEMRKDNPDAPAATLLPFPDAFFGILESHTFREGFHDGILGNDMRSVDDL